MTTTSATMTTSTAKSASRTGRHEPAPVWRRCTKTVQAKTKERTRTICLKNGYCSSNAYNLVTMVLRGKSACLLILCINCLGGWGGGLEQGRRGGVSVSISVLSDGCLGCLCEIASLEGPGVKVQVGLSFKHCPRCGQVAHWCWRSHRHLQRFHDYCTGCDF